MECDGDLLLEMYRAARTLPADEFPSVAMAMLKTAIGFDAGRLISARLAGDTVTVQGSIMYNIPVDNALDWEEIQRKDLVLPHVLARPGVPLSFHSPTLFAGDDHTIIRDYADRYGHQNGLVMVLNDADTGSTDGLSFYRNDRDDHFERRELGLMRVVMAHLQEALKINRQLAEAAPPAPVSGALVIARTDGAIEHCGQQAQQLMQSEWHPWHRARLPVPLLAALDKTGAAGYRGKRVVVRCKRVNGLLFLRLMPLSPLERLTPRELEVACLYATGLAAKMVAARLHITPATARNMLQSVYQKLGIGDKASLANIVSQRCP